MTSLDGAPAADPTISVVIPLLNEEESLRELASRLEATLEPMAGGAYEVFFVDDGSTDRSFEVIKEIHRNNPRFKAIRFRTNYGKSAALAVGFERTRGRYVFTMDADLQDDPNELPAMLELLKGEYDLVSGWKKRRHDPWHKTAPSKLFNKVVQMVTGLDIHDFNCGLKGYRREVLPFLYVYGEMHRYLPAQAHWQGFHVTEIAVQHHARKYGHSKFGMSRFVKGFLDLLTLVLTTKYARRPLHVFGTVGVVVAAVGFVIDLWLSVEWFLGLTSLTNRPLALLGVLMIIVGVQLISIGLIGEMIAKNFLSNRDYSIREHIE
ncbi:MAG: glycosyltransferase family 2 protein [Bacteroidetes bacterium]|nr:glycosyltransferase family 2 protein [Bacteroidota bacterium]